MKKLLSITLLAFVAMVGQAQSSIGTLAKTYWRNEQTGAWDIGFTEKHAIYDCRLWDYGNIHDLHWLHADDMDSFIETIDKMNK